MVPERSEEAGVEDISEPARSRPPLPEKQETAPFQDVTDRNEPASPTLTESGSSLGSRGKEAHQFSNQPRRQSLVPSERSVKAKTSPVAHPGIIRLYATFNDSTSLYFVLDLARNGELLGFIRKCGSLDLISARYYAAQLVDTLEFMHDRGVIHRDLKPENILLDDDMRIRITDFGSAKLIGKNGSTVAEEGKKRSFVGSADFVSPEVLRNEPVVLA